MTYSPLGYYGNALGSLSRLDVVAFLFSVQGSVCSICGRYMRKRHATIDHVIPRGLGGPHHILNWALAHRPCNQRKGCTMPLPDQLARHQVLQRKIRRALFWMRMLAPFHRVRILFLGDRHV
jgi:hypothetical protein